MKKLISIFVFCSFLVIIAFLLFGNVEQWVEVNLKSRHSLATYTVFSFAILTSDIILPIPSSLVMILNGKMLGVILGTALSLISGVASSCIGFYFGRKANPFIDRFFSATEKHMSQQLFARFGNIAIAISKALPIISEAISFVSGTAAVPFKTFLLYSIAGHLIVSLIYAYVGSFSTSLNSNLVAGIIIISALLVGWILQSIIMRRTKPDCRAGG